MGETEGGIGRVLAIRGHWAETGGRGSEPVPLGGTERSIFLCQVFEKHLFCSRNQCPKRALACAGLCPLSLDPLKPLFVQGQIVSDGVL